MIKKSNLYKNIGVFGLILLFTLSISYGNWSDSSLEKKDNGKVNPNIQAPPEGYNQLQTLQILEDSNPGGWAGDAIGALETENGMFPLDWTQTYDGLPSLRVNVMEITEWWIGLIVLAGWNTVGLNSYLAQGTLEFNILGNVGGEQFSIGFRDKVYERAEESIDVTAPSSNFVSLTTEWQHVSIPLSQIFPPGSQINLDQILCLVIGPSGGIVPMEFWINNIDIQSPQTESSFPEIKVNQLGYVTGVEKYALVSGFVEELTADVGTSFEVRNAIDDSLAYSGTLSLVTEYDPDVSGEKVLNADFSSVDTPGSYYISVLASGIANSPIFEIGDNIYDDLLIDASRYFYYQRANEELTEPNADGYPHTSFHSQDFNAPLESGYNGITKDVSSGWYDAGDFGKYTNAGATAIQDLLWAYELFPEQFSDNHLNIPESGNGISDILDEIKIELEFILNMQDATSGGFYHRVQSIGDDISESQRAIKDIGDGGEQNIMPTPSSADSVAVLARASTIYDDLDPTFASEMLAAAQLGWTYLENNPNYIGIPSGPYTDDNDQDDRLFAAACLYLATGQSAYNNYFLSNYNQFASTLDNPESGHFVGSNELPAFFTYLNVNNPDQSFIDWITPKFSSWRTAQIDRVNRVAWRNSLEAWQYWWGSNMMVLNIPMDIVIGSKLLGDYQPSYGEMVRANMNYILGINPMQISMVSGYGTRSTTAVFSNIYSFDGKEGLPKGILPGGPNMYENAMTSKFSAKCYTNTNTEWTSSEHTIYWNSPLVFDAAFIVSEASDGNKSPILSQPADISYQVGNAGNSINWVAIDDNPATYTISQDGIIVDSGSWVSGNIILINIDGLPVDTYMYSITVVDSEGASAFDSVIVIVTPENTDGGEVWMADIENPSVGDVFNSAFLVNTGTQNFAAFGLDITFDPGIIQISAIISSISGLSIVQNIDNNAGTATIAGFSTSSAGPSQMLEIFQIQWNAFAEGTSTISIQVNDLTDSDTNVIGNPIGISNSITVTPPFDLGDVNHDEIVNIVDALLISQYYVGQEVDIDLSLADVNEDGVINIVDALLVSQYYVGIIDTLPPT